jgi:putative glutamine amidotransferase
MHRPRIGIPLTLDDRGRWREGRDYHYIDRRYADAIVSAGGLALQLPIQPEVEPLLDVIDGLLLPGGDDFPSDGPLPPEVELDLVADEQLAFDQALYREAHARALPVLGICYGMQLMAYSLGGQLDAHLPSQRPEAAPHRLASEARHAVEIAEQSRLAEIAGTRSLSVNSLHHQAIRTSGPSFRAVAFAPDGVIEAIEPGDTASERWELGVQWHPEKQNDADSDRLFRAFIAACRSRSGRS